MPPDTSTPDAPPAPDPVLPPGFAPPPADAKIPATPENFEPTGGHGGAKVTKAELATLPLAIQDLQRFSTYAQVLGSTAPSIDEVLSTFTVALQWSMMRKGTVSWAEYAKEQEDIVWVVMRVLMERLKGAFELAAKTTPSLGTTFVHLRTFLGVKTVSAQKGAATKRRNKQKEAEGKEPTAGQVGKRHQRALEKAALAEKNAAKAPAPSAAPATNAPAPPPANGAPPTTNGTAPTTNGTAHS